MIFRVRTSVVAKKASSKKTGSASKKKARNTVKNTAKKTAVKKAAKKKAPAKVARKTVKTAAKKAVKKTVRKAAKTTAKKPVKKAAKATAKKPVKTAAKKAVKKTVKKAVKKTVKKAAKATVKKPTKKAARKAAKTVAPPVARPRKVVKSTLAKSTLAKFRRMLLDKRHDLIGDMNGLQAETLGAGRNGAGDLSNMPTHPADLGTDNYEHEFSLGLLESERMMLTEIDEALLRISEGTYGVCMGTGKPIGMPRLRAKPWAKYAIDYARKVEQGLVRPGEDDDDEDYGL